MDPLELRDLSAPRNEYLWKPPAAAAARLERALSDRRDAPALWLLVNVVAYAVPGTLAVYAVEPGTAAAHAAGAAYLAGLLVLFLQRFLLCLHVVEHRRLLRWRGVEGAIANGVPAFLLAPLFGVPSGMYRAHHIAMHHVEGNAWGKDLSSTEGYQRDSVAHFALYLARYYAGVVEVPLCVARHGRWDVAVAAAAGECAHLGVTVALWQMNRTATLWVLVLPFFIASVALMFGNWSQHIFVDPDAPRDDYRLSYDLIDHPDNQKTFNDGYHVEHHVSSLTHWTELPLRFLDAVGKHAECDSLVFRGASTFDVGLCVMTGRLGWLAERYVNVGQPARSKAELVELMRRRLRPVGA